MTVRGVILDVDGTLVDSNDAHAHSWVEAFREHGLVVPYETVRPLIGMGGDRLIEEAAEIEGDDPLRDAIETRRTEIFEERYLPHVKAFPRVRELLEKMRDEDLGLVVASSSEESLVKKLLMPTGAQDLIDDHASPGEGGESKPDPDIVLVALEKLRVSPEEAIMLGDTPYDVEAASAAGVSIIGLRCGGWNDVALKGAVAIYDDPSDLLSRFEASPVAFRT